jgi:hypothetical protein
LRPQAAATGTIHLALIANCWLYAALHESGIGRLLYDFGGTKRSTLYNTPALSCSYAFAAVTHSNLFERDGALFQMQTHCLAEVQSKISR